MKELDLAGTPLSTNVRQEARRASTRGRTIVVTSGKGGVGKTTTTANLGTGLADLGKQVAVVDADVGLRNLDVVLGLENRIRKHLLDVIERKGTIDEALVRDRLRQSLFLLPAAQNREKDEVPQAAMVALIQELQNRFDFVLIDCPAGIEHGFRNAVAGAAEAIIVTTPEVSAVRDADRIIGLLPSHLAPKLIVNRVRPGMVKEGTMMSVDDVNAILRLELIGVVPDEKDIIIATNRGTPVIDIEGSQTGAAFRRIVRRLLGEAIPIPPFHPKRNVVANFLSSLGIGRS
ncbi:MAG: septum site-determining protein MinD [Candidatus Eremiobacteraeota bacterium]|nr:septum site-determining protein MinD [Candidatus Eremiobacteraeota bacterium]MBC5827913.1 septum site-determining protein MinD [Candidatus Eremiobacteraeota bacterium]